MTRRAPGSHRIADGIFRLCTPVPPSAFPGGFTFNQYLILDDEPLLFHTGHRRLFPAVSAALTHQDFTPIDPVGDGASPGVPLYSRR